jgi:hypothetical protein
VACYRVNLTFTFTFMILIPKPCMRAIESQTFIEYILVAIFLETGHKFIPFLN